LTPPPLLRPVVMAECPKCKRKFPSVFGVSRHLNQRWSTCALQHPHLVAATLPPTFVLPTPGSANAPIESVANEAVDQNYPLYEANLFDPDPLDSDAMVADSNQLPPAGLPDRPVHQSTQYFREDFPGAGGFAFQGTTFMERFDKDSHSRERSKNPYYPFASRQEWQLGYFLLSSRMSLALINEFLRLDLVRSFPDIQQPFSSDFRLKPCPSHFVPPKSCDLVPKCFHLGGLYTAPRILADSMDCPRTEHGLHQDNQDNPSTIFVTHIINPSPGTRTISGLYPDFTRSPG
jgi:hypothetical protein